MKTDTKGLSNVEVQIENYISSQTEPKRGEMEKLHQLILNIMPGCKLWFFDGLNEEKKIISNPNIGYGQHTFIYAKGNTRDFYKIGISAIKTGISIYFIGLKDKCYLAKTYGAKIGNAKITGYCISFRSLNKINIEILKDALRFGFS